MFCCVVTKIGTGICLYTPYKCTKFQLDQSTHLRVGANFLICAKIQKKEKKKKQRTKTETLVSNTSETLGAIYFKFGIQPPLIGRLFHHKFGDLQVKGDRSMNA